MSVRERERRRRNNYRRLLDGLRRIAQLKSRPASSPQPNYPIYPRGQGQCPRCGQAELKCVASQSGPGLREFFDCGQCGARFQPPWGALSMAEELALRGRSKRSVTSSDRYQWH